jgi:hypothetical protein
VNELLPDYSVELLDRRTRAVVVEHLETCSGCRGELAAMEHAMRLVREHAGLNPPPGLWNGVANRLAAGEGAEPPLSPLRWLWRGPWRGLVMGGATVAAAAWALFFTLGPPPNLPPPESSADPKVMAIERQRALASAESPFGDRAAWEIQLARSARGERSTAP